LTNQFGKKNISTLLMNFMEHPLEVKEEEEIIFIVGI
jgi:hypothetical protein